MRGAMPKTMRRVVNALRPFKDRFEELEATYDRAAAWTIVNVKDGDSRQFEIADELVRGCSDSSLKVIVGQRLEKLLKTPVAASREEALELDTETTEPDRIDLPERVIELDEEPDDA